MSNFGHDHFQLEEQIEQLGFEVLAEEVGEKKRLEILRGVERGCAIGAQMILLMGGGALLFRHATAAQDSFSSPKYSGFTCTDLSLVGRHCDATHRSSCPIRHDFFVGSPYAVVHTRWST